MSWETSSLQDTTHGLLMATNMSRLVLRRMKPRTAHNLQVDKCIWTMVPQSTPTVSRDYKFRAPHNITNRLLDMRTMMTPSLQQRIVAAHMNDTTVRRGTLDDIPEILNLMRQRPGNLKQRSVEDLTSMVHKQHGVVGIANQDIQLQSGAIGRGEVVFFIEEALIDVDADGEKAVYELFQRHFQVQEGDIIIYLGSFVAARGYRGLMKVKQWLVARHGETVFNARMQRRRIIFMGGIMATDKFNQTQDIQEAICGAILNAYPLEPEQLENQDDHAQLHDNNMHRIFRPCSPADGSGREGFMCILHVDPAPTALQLDRLTRNAVLITEVEQRRLLQSRIGFLGLSTGSVALEICLREGLGGIYRIADFDIFEASNANRMLFSPLDDVGKMKTELVERAIAAVDPDLRVEIYAGLTEKNVQDFVQNCDLIVEECDSFAMKVLVRQVAQKFGIPVLMGTSQNGMIDVERYDMGSNWTSPLLNVVKQDCPDVEPSVAQNIAFRSIFDMKHFSPRAEMMLEEMAVGNISSWSQLAEEVALNGACIAHAARRILLGDRTLASGRFSVKLDDLFREENRISTKTKINNKMSV